jgi:hypothetical protein
MRADIKAEDRGELVSLMEPLLITDSSRCRGPLTDLAFDLTQKSAGFRRSLPPSTMTARLGTNGRPLPDGRGSDQSHDRQGVDSRNGKKLRGQRTRWFQRLMIRAASTNESSVCLAARHAWYKSSSPRPSSWPIGVAWDKSATAVVPLGLLRAPRWCAASYPPAITNYGRSILNPVRLGYEFPEVEHL